LMLLSNLLETGQFLAFWAADRSVAESVPSFDESIRKFILGVLGSTYISLSKVVLAEYLGLSPADVLSFVNAQGLKAADDGTIIFKSSDSSQATAPKRTTDTNRAKDFQRMLSAIR